jgi:hypothetical protein
MRDQEPQKAGWQGQHTQARRRRTNVLANDHYVIMPVDFTQRCWIQSPQNFLNRSGEGSV